MPDNYQDKVNLSIKNIAQNFEGGLSNTSTKKFDELITIISEISGIPVEDVYITSAIARPSNVWNRLSQGKPLTHHFKLAVCIVSENSVNGALAPLKAFIGDGTVHYDSIAILAPVDGVWTIPNIVTNGKYDTAEKFKVEFPEIIVTVENEVSSKKIAEWIDAPYQLIVYGAPGTGKSFSTDCETKGKATFRTTFHPDTDYANFVGSYKPTMAIDPYETVVKVGTQNGGNIIQQDRLVRKSEISYDFVPQSFISAYVAAWKKYAARIVAGGALTDEDQVYLVIEEINRGHCAQIFGDLFQLLDRNEEGFSDYPIDADVDLAKWLHAQFAADNFGDELKAIKGYEEDGKLVLKLCLPPNLFIRATMNTSDQSLFPMDSAFKRRWDWRYVPISEPDKDEEPDFNKRKVLCKLGGEDKLERRFDWWEFLKVINAAILHSTKSEDKQLGYFFVKVPNNPGEISAEKFAGKVLFYLYNDVFKDYNYPDAVFAKKNQPAGSPKVKYSFKDFFDAKGRAKDAMVAEFLENLGVPFEDKQLPA